MVSTLWSLELIGKTQGIYRQKVRHEEWVEFTQTWEYEGEIFEETIEHGGIEQETYLFHETIFSVFLLGKGCYELKLYDVYTDAIHSLKKIGEEAMKNGFDNDAVIKFLAMLGNKALSIKNKKIVNIYVNAMQDISETVDKNLRATMLTTVKSLITMGTIAYQNNLSQIASLAAQILADLEGNKISSKKLDEMFNATSLDIQEFRKLYRNKKQTITKEHRHIQNSNHVFDNI